MKTLIKILCLSVLWFSCESSTEPEDNVANLIGNWNYLTRNVTITDIDGQVTEDNTEYDEENSSEIIFNEDGSWNQSVFEGDNVINYSGTWSADGFILVMIYDDIPIESEIEYTFSDNSNTLSMFYSQIATDADGNLFATYDVVLELERINQ